LSTCFERIETKHASVRVVNNWCAA
jgi:hypothetical protein